LLTFDSHIHSSYSLDSIFHPKFIIKLAKLKGLGAIAVTDHDTILGGIKTQLHANSNLLVITGCEVKTEFGDLIGLFLNEELRSRKFEEVVDEIRDQGGLAVLPHPYRRKILPPETLLKKVDLIEGFNGRTSVELNQKGLMLAKSLGKPAIAGSDAHIPYEVGLATTIFYDIQYIDQEMLRKCILRDNMGLSFARPLPALDKVSAICGYAIKKARSI